MEIKSRFRIPSAVIAACMVFASFGIGIAVGIAKSTVFGASGPMMLNGSPAAVPEGVDLTTFWTVWNLLNDKFVATTASSSKATDDQKLWGAMQGLASSYGDPYTVFMPPVEAKGFAETVAGSFSGVGMEIGIKDKILTVVAPLKGSPAEKAGLVSGDKILAIDGVSTEGLAVDQAVGKIRGESGTKVKLLVQHASDTPKEIEITRAPIEVPVVETTSRPDGVFVIAIYTFSAPSADRFREALREFIQSGSSKLVIDLRGNPGGYLEAAVDIASYFLPLGETIVTEDYAGKQVNEVHHSKGYNVFAASGRNIKTVVLINGGSASASEILAGALHDQGVATLIGEKSFGKGSVQELINLPGGASLKVTVARWLTPHGMSISQQGIVPDQEVKFTEEDFKAKKDPQMDAAAKYLLTQ
jgi:carboxyl-terminal processing protease